MSQVSVSRGHRRHSRAIRERRAAPRLQNFERGTRWVVCCDGESYGSYTSSHDCLARAAGYNSEDQAYRNGALRVHYDTLTNAIRIEAQKATPQAIALANQVIDKVPAALAHVAIGEGKNFRSYMGKPTQVVADISRNNVVICRGESTIMQVFLPSSRSEVKEDGMT